MEQKFSNLNVMEAANHSKNSAMEAENHVKYRTSLMSRGDFLRTAGLGLASIFFIGCGKDKDKDNGASGKFSPPKWIQGVWENTQYGSTYKFTSNDVFMIAGGEEVSFSSMIIGKISVKETINTDEIYEITVSQSDCGEECVTVTKFTKGDGTYINLQMEIGGVIKYNKKQ